MKKILFLTNVPSPYRVEFFNLLAKHCDLTVLYQKKRSDERDDKWSAEATQNYRSIFLKGKSTNTDSAICLDVVKYLKKGVYDQIIICGIASPTEMLAIQHCQLHGIPYAVEGDGAFYEKGNVLKERLKHHLLSHCSLAFSTCHEHSKYYMAYGVKPEKIHKYPFSSIHEQDIKQVTPKQKAAMKEKLHIAEKKMVMTVGQFIPRKGFDLLLEASKGFDEETGVYFIGGQPTSEYEAILKDHPQKDHIHFISFLSKEELVEYYQAADLFVFPTREDIWGLVVNEAMAYGLPVITTTRCNAGLEMVKEGENGYLIPINDIESLKNITNKALCHSFDTSVIYNTIDRYTIEAMVRAHCSILNLK